MRYVAFTDDHHLIPTIVARIDRCVALNNDHHTIPTKSARIVCYVAFTKNHHMIPTSGARTSKWNAAWKTADINVINAKESATSARTNEYADENNPKYIGMVTWKKRWAEKSESGKDKHDL